MDKLEIINVFYLWPLMVIGTIAIVGLVGELMCWSMEKVYLKPCRVKNKQY